jgi:hypothetical protein
MDWLAAAAQRKTMEPVVVIDLTSEAEESSGEEEETPPPPPPDDEYDFELDPARSSDPDTPFPDGAPQYNLAFLGTEGTTLNGAEVGPGLMIHTADCETAEYLPFRRDVQGWSRVSSNERLSDVYVRPPRPDANNANNTLYVVDDLNPETNIDLDPTEPWYRLTRLVRKNYAIAAKVPGGPGETQAYAYVMPSAFKIGIDPRDVVWVDDRQRCWDKVNTYEDARLTDLCKEACGRTIKSERLRKMVVVDSMLIRAYANEQWQHAHDPSSQPSRPCPVRSLDLVTEYTDRVIAGGAPRNDADQPFWSLVNAVRCSSLRAQGPSALEARMVSQKKPEVSVGVVFWYRDNPDAARDLSRGCTAYSGIVANKADLVRKAKHLGAQDMRAVRTYEYRL